jgi:hypothetical protein
LLLVAAAGTGVWLLGCVAHQASAQAETALPQPVPAAAGAVTSVVIPVGSAVPDPAERTPVAGVLPAAGGGLVWDVPVLPPLGSALLPPARSGETGAVPRSPGRQAADAYRPGSRPALPRMAEPELTASPITEPVRPGVAAASTELAPHPRPLPVPGPGLPLLPGGDAFHAPDGPHSLPLAESVPGPAFGPAAGLTAPRVVSTADARQRAYLPDTPPD